MSISSNVFIPLSLNIWSITLNTFTVVSTSSNALCATSTLIPKFSAIIPNLYFLNSGNKSFASLNVSKYVLSNFRPSFSQLYFIKLVSKSALCATKTESPKNSKTFGISSSIVGASFTISSVMFVISWTLIGIGFSGFTNVSNVSITSPFLTFIIPISVIFSVLKDIPVVSKSNTQYVVSSKVWPLPLLTIGSLSGTKYPSTP